jgi:flavin-dependent thymidylate synthase
MTSDEPDNAEVDVEMSATYPADPGHLQIMRWADSAMYSAEPIDAVPSVTLLYMTPDPLRVMAAAAELYKGRVVRDTRLVSRGTATAWLADMEKTTLKAAMEFVDFHFLLEGVTRSFTHQLVRQRTAVFVQESLRFAVKEGEGYRVALPPSLLALPDDHPWRVAWSKAVNYTYNTYTSLVNSGMPAEDARDLLPHGIATRIHYKTNLRNLYDHAGYRLCSQAQFHWKVVWAGMLDAIRNYASPVGYPSSQWQQEMIADLFKPICYQTNKCEFMGSADRACSIRDRVEAHHRVGETSDQWTDIDPREPILEGAARKPQARSNDETGEAGAKG